MAENALQSSITTRNYKPSKLTTKWNSPNIGSSLKKRSSFLLDLSVLPLVSHTIVLKTTLNVASQCSLMAGFPHFTSPK